MATRPEHSVASNSTSYLIPFIAVTALFGFFGFLTNMNSNLSPKLEDLFQLNLAWANMVDASWFFASLIFSIPAAKLIEAVGDCIAPHRRSLLKPGTLTRDALEHP